MTQDNQQSVQTKTQYPLTNRRILTIGGCVLAILVLVIVCMNVINAVALHDPNQQRLGKENGSLSYDDYWIGMSMDDFMKLPLPKPMPFDHTELVTQDDHGAKVFQFRGATLPLGGSDWRPRFCFSRNAENSYLSGFDGEVPYSAVPAEVAATSVYGHVTDMSTLITFSTTNKTRHG